MVLAEAERVLEIPIRVLIASIFKVKNNNLSQYLLHDGISWGWEGFRNSN